MFRLVNIVKRNEGWTGLDFLLAWTCGRPSCVEPGAKFTASGKICVNSLYTNSQSHALIRARVHSIHLRVVKVPWAK